MNGEEMEELKAGWKKVNLGDIIKVQKGYAFKSKDFLNKGIKIIKVSNLENETINFLDCACISEENFEKYKKYALNYKDIIITTVGSWPNNKNSVVGKVVRVPQVNEKLLLNQNAIRVTALEKYLQEYIYYALKDSKFKYYIEGVAQGSANQASITLEDIKEYELKIPSLKVQKKIVSILASLDEKIELNRKINQNLEETAQTLFKRWFIDFEFPNEEGKPYKSSGGKMIESELGEIPEKFYSKKAYEVCDLSIGKTPSRKDTDCFKKKKEKGVKWVSISDMNKNEPFLNETNEKITPEAVSKYKVKVINKGSIILSFKLTIGRVKILGENMTTNEAIAHFNIENKILKEYLYLFLKNFNYEKLGNTSSIANAVNSKVIKNIEVILPNENLLFLFHNKVKNIFEKIYILQKETEKLIELRDYLLPRLMSGEISV